jgi:hypothetical protein
MGDIFKNRAAGRVVSDVEKSEKITPGLGDLPRPRSHAGQGTAPRSARKGARANHIETSRHHTRPLPEQPLHRRSHTDAWNDDRLSQPVRVAANREKELGYTVGPEALQTGPVPDPGQAVRSAWRSPCSRGHLIQKYTQCSVGPPDAPIHDLDREAPDPPAAASPRSVPDAWLCTASVRGPIDRCTTVRMSIVPPSVPPAA